MENIHFKRRILPPIFSLMNLHDDVVVGYDDNVIGDERWWISNKGGIIVPFAVKPITSDTAIINVVVRNNIREITVNENPEVYSDKQREFIRETFNFFSGK